MKKLYTFTITEDECSALESLLNNFRVCLNDWDKSKKFNVQGHEFRVYTIVCDEDTFDSFVIHMNAQRVY